MMWWDLYFQDLPFLCLPSMQVFTSFGTIERVIIGRKSKIGMEQHWYLYYNHSPWLSLFPNIELASKHLLKASLFSKLLIWLASYFITRWLILQWMEIAILGTHKVRRSRKCRSHYPMVKSLYLQCFSFFSLLPGKPSTIPPLPAVLHAWHLIKQNVWMVHSLNASSVRVTLLEVQRN